MTSIKIQQLLEDSKQTLHLELVAGKGGLGRRISSPRIQKPGLALTGFTEHLHPDRVQVFGNTEISYLNTLNEDEQRQALASMFESELACVAVTKNLQVPKALIDGCEKANLTLMRSPLQSLEFIEYTQSYLEHALSATATIHGVLMDVFGVGVLLIGKSGIGKSEIALDLVMRGHRLVADDVVFVTRRSDNQLYGHGSERLQHHMEIRGLGIISIKNLFGVAAVRDRKKIELVIELVEWNQNEEYDRLGVEQRSYNLVGVPVLHSLVPVRPGRNLSTIVEVAARNHLLKLSGHHSAKDFAERLSEEIANGPTNARFRKSFLEDEEDVE